jgi:hypothetical protein
VAGFDAFVAWFALRRAMFGGFFLGLSAMLAGAGQLYDAPEVTKLGGLFFIVGSPLMAAGMSESDKAKREAKAVIETRIDRRNPESLIPIPAKDLRKLVAADPALAKVEAPK